MMQKVLHPSIVTYTISQPEGFDTYYAYVQYYQFTSTSTDTPYWRKTHAAFVLFQYVLYFLKQLLQ